jgi:hypothetical protein
MTDSWGAVLLAFSGDSKEVFVESDSMAHQMPVGEYRNILIVND